jgi:hypothetical protein
MINALGAHLLAHWDQVGGGRRMRPRAIHWLKVSRYGDMARPYVHFYVFLDDAPAPAFVAKITAERAARERLAHEFELIRRLRRRVGEAIAATIPAPVAEIPFGAYWIGLEEMARGRRFVPAVALGRRGEEERIRRYLSPVVDWLIAFGRSGCVTVEFDGDVYAHAVAEPLARLARYHALGRDEAALVAELGAHLRAFRGRPVPAIALHGDVWPGNIFVAGDRVSVIDWDGYREHDASYHDIYTLLSSFVVAGGPPGPEPAASFAATFYADSWFSRLVRAELARYTAAIGVDPELVTLMLPFFLVRMAVRRDPATPVGRAMNAKFAGLLTDYLRALAAGEAPDVRPARPEPAARPPADPPAPVPPIR